MITILAIIFLVLGLIIGSFLNVVIFRYNTHRTFRGRSGCLSCQNKLSWYELIPVFSFLALRGRCKNCKTRISIQYPIVELLTGIVFAGLFLKLQNAFFFDTIGFSIAFAFYATIFSLLIVISVYDLKHKIIPNSFALTFGILSFIGLFLFSSFNFNPHFPSLMEFLSGIFIALPFLLMWLLSKGSWMGLGDAKLAVGIGWFLGLSLALSSLVIAFWAGALIGILLIIFSKKYSLKSEIPFAPFMVFGAMLIFLLPLHIFPLGF
ncbi:MAG TPA: prepilin peptidase [Candidatus Paceibacterota bacterium]|nr:prepilin peptidase [Candidatus Paceibacterota bacterium]HPT18230.1 prepilin peptidase [Candidatus Paceibacterota bacterium]